MTLEGVLRSCLCGDIRRLAIRFGSLEELGLFFEDMEGASFMNRVAVSNINEYKRASKHQWNKYHGDLCYSISTELFRTHDDRKAIFLGWGNYGYYTEECSDYTVVRFSDLERDDDDLAPPMSVSEFLALSES